MLRREEAIRLVLESRGYTTSGDVLSWRQSEFYREVENKEQELTGHGWKPECLEPGELP